MPAAARPATCPCGLPADYGECCGRYHSGSAEAPTAELLMRSRYSAFALRDKAYLLKSWAAEARPAALTLGQQQWTGLTIHRTTAGGLFDQAGTVEFTASYIDRGRAGNQREHSAFRRDDGAWVYVGPVMEGLPL